ASISGSKMVSTADQLLKQYDGICIGFKMSYTGPASGDKTVAPSDTTSNSSAGGIGTLLNILKNSTSK
ncbi:MAG: DUF4923 family protein, partial [Muribaculaceae bacterium]|nr:DUF4923 family protein [Muribaculaceae bacterium]